MSISRWGIGGNGLDVDDPDQPVQSQRKRRGRTQDRGPTRGRGPARVPVDPSSIPPQALNPDFKGNVLHDLSHAYSVVFAAAVGLVALTLVPVAFLPKKPAGQMSKSAK
ncbi:emrB efflux domain protein [Mycobacterium kansasii 824]|nr:emrB efflux domain protein [Mycobacterium kansasii 824]